MSAYLVPAAARLRARARSSWVALTLAAAAMVSPLAARADTALIIRSSDSPTDGPTVQAVANLGSWLTDAGHAVTFSTGLAASLAGYGQVWDLGFRRATTANDLDALLGYLQQGGRLVMIGENGVVFGARNAGVAQLVAQAGGGALAPTAGPNGLLAQTVRPPFDSAGSPSTVSLAVPGYFTGTGTGSWVMALADDSMGSGVAFGAGDLANAQAGTMVAMLDIDFMGDIPSQSAMHGLARNLVGYMSSPVSQVPEPPAPLLLAAGMLLLAARRRLHR